MYSASIYSGDWVAYNLHPLNASVVFLYKYCPSGCD